MISYQKCSFREFTLVFPQDHNQQRSERLWPHILSSDLSDARRSGLCRSQHGTEVQIVSQYDSYRARAPIP